MNSNEYMTMLYNFDDAFDNAKKLLISWSNGLKVRCSSLTGVYETDTEPGDEDYIGEYAVGINEIEVLEKGSDNSIEIYDNSMEISLVNIPEKITLEDGRVIWERKP